VICSGISRTVDSYSAQTIGRSHFWNRDVTHDNMSGKDGIYVFIEYNISFAESFQIITPFC